MSTELCHTVRNRGNRAEQRRRYAARKRLKRLGEFDYAAWAEEQRRDAWLRQFKIAVEATIDGLWLERQYVRLREDHIDRAKRGLELMLRDEFRAELQKIRGESRRRMREGTGFGTIHSAVRDEIKTEIEASAKMAGTTTGRVCGALIEAVWRNGGDFVQAQSDVSKKYPLHVPWRQNKPVGLMGQDACFIGAWGEVCATKELMERGMRVARAVDPTCPFDLTAWDGKKLHRVQVKVIPKSNPRGTQFLGELRKDAVDCDLFAIVSQGGDVRIFGSEELENVIGAVQADQYQDYGSDAQAGEGGCCADGCDVSGVG